MSPGTEDLPALCLPSGVLSLLQDLVGKIQVMTIGSSAGSMQSYRFVATWDPCRNHWEAGLSSRNASSYLLWIGQIIANVLF